MRKGFFATAVLLASIATLYYTSIGQNILIEKMERAENKVKMNQRTQENKYRLTHGFKDTVRQSMQDTVGEKPEKRELITCLELENWVKNLKENEREVELKTGHIDPVSYKYKETVTSAFQLISSSLKKDPSQALGELKPRSMYCMNYISIKEEDRAYVKNNGYIEGMFNQIVDGEPSFILETRVGKSEQKVIVPSKTVIRLKDR